MSGITGFTEQNFAPPQDERDHSATPWTIRQEGNDALVIVDANGNDTTVIADIQHDPGFGIFGDPDGAHRDMRRIVACVNACAGISTEALESTGSVILSAESYGAVQRQRDELLAALRYVLEDEPSGIPRATSACRNVVAQAIAKAEAETNQSAVPTQPN